MRMLFGLSCLSYLLIGLAHVVLGSVLEQLILHYGLNYSEGSQLIFNQFAGFLVGVMTVPWLLRRIGRRNTLLIALTSLTIAECIYSLLPNWGIMLFISPFAGLGFGMIEAAVGALIISFITDRTASAMSRLEVFFGIGALLMPLAAGLLINMGNWAWSFPLVALVSLLTLLLWWLAPLGTASEMMSERRSDVPRHELPKYTRHTMPILILMIIYFLVYVGAEMSFVHFIPTILIENVNIDPSIATVGITVFWITMVVGRLFAGSVADRIGYARYLLISGAGMFVAMILFALSGSLWISLTVILILGFFMAGMFAIALIFANHRIPGLTERTTSLLVAAGGLGGALFPRWIGWVMDHYPLSVTYGILIGSAAMLFLLVAAAAWPGRLQAASRE
jgi:FHS family glucose/mannose:H+ symporter-like MFS transporter